jgi:predicted nucleic acid-binding Zn ribbon protein
VSDPHESQGGEPVAAREDPPSGVDLARAALARAQKQARATGGQKRSSRPVREPRLGSDRDPQLFGATLDRLVTDRGWKLPAAAVGVMDRWPEIVGAEVASRTEPVSFADGVLAVRAASTAWATQLRLMSPDIVRRLNVELGHGSVTRLDVRGPDAPSWNYGPLRARDGRGPRDTYG